MEKARSLQCDRATPAGRLVGRAALRPVEVGLLNDELAEISSGLSAGEVVLLAPDTNLRDGTRVKAILRE